MKKLVFLLWAVFAVGCSAQISPWGKLDLIQTVGENDKLLIFDWIYQAGYDNPIYHYKSIKWSDLKTNLAVELSNTHPIEQVQSGQTLTSADEMMLVNAQAGTVTLILPVTEIADGKEFIIKKVDNTANGVFFYVQGGGLVDNVSVYSIYTPYKAVTVRKYGANYYVK